MSEGQDTTPCGYCKQEECFADSEVALRLIEDASLWSDAVCEAMAPGKDPDSARRYHCYREAAKALGMRARTPLPSCILRKVQDAFGESKVGFKRRPGSQDGEGSQEGGEGGPIVVKRPRMA